MELRQKRKHERMTAIEEQTRGFSKPQLLGLIAGLELERDEARANLVEATDVLRRWIHSEDELLREMATRMDGG